ncbi:MAG: pitrilysin family protein [Oligoflexia bacterium]|nr:pitrilysin family protein [Oligoflexia bacterium]
MKSKFLSAVFLFCVTLSASTAAVAAERDFRLPTPILETLPNGLQIAWFLSDTLPVVDLALVVASGERDDPAGKSGTADLMAAALTRGAGGMTEKDLAHAIETLGASWYSTTDDDASSVGMHGLAPDAPVLLDLLAKVTLHPEFAPQQIERERARMIDRWEHMPDYGANLVGLAMHGLLARGTIYGRGGFVSEREFKRIGREDVVAFHRKNFTPKNSILMVVGRVNKADFRAKIMRLFGDWKGEVPRRAWVKYSDPKVQARPGAPGEVVVIDRPSLTQAEVRLGFQGPLFNDPDRYPLAVANALLGEYFESRLNSLIRDKLGLTYSIQSSFTYAEHLGTFGISSATRNEAVGQVVWKTIEVLKDLRAGDISEGEVQTAKDYLIGGFPLGTSTLGSVASRWVGGWLFGLGPDYLNEFVPKVSAVSVDAVRKAVAKTFHLGQMQIAVAGDGKAIEKSLKEAGISYRRIPVAALVGAR